VKNERNNTRNWSRFGVDIALNLGEHPCSIVDLRTNQVRLRVEGLNEERIEEGTINVDTTIKRENIY